MKTFIFLFILLIAFFIYLFMYAPPHKDKKIEDPTIANSLTLDAIEKKVREIKEIGQEEPVDKKEYSFSENLRKSVVYQENYAKPISENVTFDTLVEIISKIKPNILKESVTLNTPMNLLLTSKEQKERFAEKIADTFKLSDTKTRELMKKNRLLWDWVNTLQQ